MRAVAFGGDGYIGRHFVRRTEAFTDVIVVDRYAPTAPTHVQADIREPLPAALASPAPDWIVHLAAVHREPGHRHHEFFETNVLGARNVAAYAEKVGCKRIFFMSTSAVYGEIGPNDESTPPSPRSAYGMSKYAAELILEGWRRAGEERRLVICRPGVVYGPNDPGNILRMINAVRRGRFVIPGNSDVRKSYAYIECLVRSMDHAIVRDDPQVIYNFASQETETLGELVRIICDEFGCRHRVPSVPAWLLTGGAYLAQALTVGRSAVHPVRVRKAAMDTHVVPRWLTETGFEFEFDFRSSLAHWRGIAPEDFELSSGQALR